MALNDALGLIGVGDIRLQFYDDAGALAGAAFDAGNGTVFEVAADSDIEKQISRKRLTAGQVLATATQNKPPKCTIKLQTVNRKNLRLAFLGTETDITQAAVTVTDEPIILYAGGWVRITKTIATVLTHIRNLDTTVAVKNSAGTTTYVEGTDYEVDRWDGSIMAISGGAIADAASCKVTCASKAIVAGDGYKISGAVKPSISVMVIFLGMNTVNNARHSVTLWKATVKPKGGVDFLSDKWAEIELEAELTTPTGKSEPFIYERY